MDILGEHLDQHRSSAAAQASQYARDRDILQWLNQGTTPEVRLLKFDAWARHQLDVKLDWTWSGPDRARRIEQCRLALEHLVIDLWRRGWMLDGKRLAKHITACLDDVAAAQKAGRVKEFWPFFKTVVDRYVGTNAEELKIEAMSAGCHASQVLTALAIRPAHGGPALPDLLAQRAQETLREKLTRRRRLEAQKAKDAQMPQLF